jgi:signal transduction histidine kinase
MPIDLTEVDAREVLTASLMLIQPLAQRRSVTVTHTGGTSALLADQRRLQQVVLNLLSNAVRFSPSGASVSLTDEEHHGLVAVSVVDSGPGIPAELQKRLFVPFDRLGADAGREGGAGLGLVLARRLTEAMGGTFELSSTVGVGTRVTASFPAACRHDD